MSDLVERLRSSDYTPNPIELEAADELERLEAEVQMLARNSISICPESFGYAYDDSGKYVAYWTKDSYSGSDRIPWFPQEIDK